LAGPNDKNGLARTGKVSTKKYLEINRPVAIEELQETFAIAREAGLYQFDIR
jgi:hypothetical protein